LKDVNEGKLTVYHSPRHSETPRFKSSQNPPIFSVIRALTKAFQYDLKIKEPLRSTPISQGSGQTAAQLGIKTVAQETKDFLAYENITRSQTGTPNVFISRKNVAGESAVFGEGFYSASGKRGGRETGMTIRFKVDPLAKEGTDFVLGQGGNSEIIVDGSDLVW